jgi:hypothetical protein
VGESLATGSPPTKTWCAAVPRRNVIDMFGRDAVAGEATIVDRRVKSTSGDALVTIYEYVADVCVPGEQPYRCVMQEPHIATNFWSPDVGAVVRVHAHLKSQTASFDKGDPQLNAKLRLRADKQRFEQTARSIPGSPPASRNTLQ